MRIARVARAAGIVAALGAFGGSIAGALAGAGVAMLLLRGHIVVGPGDLGRLVAQGALAGGAAGAIVGPLAGFGFLRQVPLWRALLLGILGTLVGFAAGVVLFNGSVGSTLAGLALGVYAARRTVGHVSRADASAAAVSPATSPSQLGTADQFPGEVGERAAKIATERRPPAAT